MQLIHIKQVGRRINMRAEKISTEGLLFLSHVGSKDISDTINI